MTENWYLVLELEFDPNPVEDEAFIEKRIDEKRKFWSSKANDFNHGPKYRRYSQMVPTIKKDMIGGENIRKELIEDACDKTYGPINKILKQIRKTEITSEMVEKIAKQQKVDDTFVKRSAKKLGIKIIESKKKNHKEIYEKYYKTKPKNTDKYNGMRELLETFYVDNLYEFLYKDSDIKNARNLPVDSLTEKAREKKKKEFYKNDSISGSGSKLCSQCEETFKDEEGKKTYDKYLVFNSSKKILESARDIYKIAGEISDEAYKNYIDQLSQLLKDRKLAIDVFQAFFKMEKMSLANLKKEKTENKNIKVCRCGSLNDVSQGRKICQACGAELEIECPKCKKINDASVKVCKCGFEFENIDKALALCELASKEIDNMEFSVAKAHLSDASKYWPNNDKVKELKNKLNSKEKNVSSKVKLIDQECKKKNYYQAKKQYLNLKKIYPNFQDKHMSEEINGAIALAEDLKEKAGKLKKEKDKVEVLSKAYQACKDCPGLKEELAKYPPLKALSLSVFTDTIGKTNVISWSRSKSEGLLFYTVVRKKEAVPVNVEDGDFIGRVSTYSIIDSGIQAGIGYYYAVFVERAGVFSQALTSLKPIINLFEISGVTASEGDKELQFNWDEIPNNTSVQIKKIVDGKEEIIKCNNKTSFIDENLINDKKYIYQIKLIYKLASKKYPTKGVEISAIPAKLPSPIEKIVVKPQENNSFYLEWENPENNKVEFFYSKKKPNFYFGDTLALSTIEKDMQRLMIKKKTDKSGVFSYKGEELIYIVAVTVKGNSVVIGGLARASKNETIKIKNVNMVNQKILIKVEPPKEASGFVVLYRHDKFPEDISDVKTTRKYIPFKQYKYDSGLVVDSNEPKNYYFSVYVEFIKEGEKEYSTATDCMFFNRPKELITYSVKLNKKIFSENILTLEFESENENFTLPDIDLMSAIGVAPMFKKSAKIFYRIESREVEGKYQVKIPLDKKMPKETHIKAFLRNEDMQENYQIKLNLKSNLKIS